MKKQPIYKFNKNLVGFEQVKNRRNLKSILIGVIIGLIIVIAGVKIFHIKPYRPIKLIPKIEIKKDVPLNYDSLFIEMVHLKILFPEIILAQIKIESGRMTSKHCIKDKNLLGIRWINQKLAIGMTKDSFAIYESYHNCLMDYRRLQQYYLQNIQKKYSKDTNYIKKIKTIK